jgi:hypothetical protein
VEINAFIEGNELGFQNPPGLLKGIWIIFIYLWTDRVEP